jgi:dipeptidyl aminopeptidase/acylaminoacyl peptidase
MMHRLWRPLVLCGLILAAPASSQTASKRSLTHKDYAAWRSIQAPLLSRDGSLLAYVLAPQEGESELVVRHLGTGKEFRQPRGSRAGVGDGPPPAARAGRGMGLPAPGTTQHLFSPDGKFIVFTIYPPRPDRSKGKTAAVTPPANALGIMDLTSGKLVRVERVRSFQVPEEGTPWLAYLRGPATKGPPAKGDTPTRGTPKGPDATPAPPVPSELILRNLTDGRERSFADVTEFRLARDGRCLVYAVASKTEDASGVYAVTPGYESPAVTLLAGPGRYSRITWDDKQRQLVFFRSITPKSSITAPPGTPAPRAEVRLFHWNRPANGTAAVGLSPGQVAKLAASYARMPVANSVPPVPFGGLGEVVALARRTNRASLASELAPNSKAAFLSDHQVSDQGQLSFSRDGGRVYFNVSPPPVRPTAPADGKAVVELWHYQDDYIQPMQKTRYSAGKRHLAVFHLADRSCRQLGDDSLSSLAPAAAGDWALGMDDRVYRHLMGGQEHVTPFDAVLVNQRTGARKPLLKKQTSALTFSPGGNYLLTFDGKDWHSLSVPDGKRVNLTAKLGVRFDNELHDTPSTPGPLGSAGWTKDGKHVLIYDRYDIWMIAADGSSSQNLTQGLGRKTTTQFRIVRLDPREQSLDPAKPLLVRAENQQTRDTGFYRVSLTGEAPKLLIMGARNYGTPVKAAKGDRYLLTISTFYDYPELFVADSDFREVKQITNAGAQKAGFVWGKAEMIRYKTLDGLPLQGVLIKPENFDPQKKYPMLVYIYERLSQNLHRFTEPRPGTSINVSYYASNGYLVLMPDIAYTVGQPGQSALKCVGPAIQAVVDQGCVDEKAIGIQGHSWGGYQTAYLITQTTRFKAAAAGAPVCNMTSAYGGIRWGTGLPRQFQYERTQSRIGGSLWQYQGRFVENSPLFYADRIKTPLLMLHNDRDEAVPWQQGIEYYLALRRLGKEVYLFNYPNEGHGLRQRVNQADYTVRMQEFFDHHLKGATKPEWMAKGIAYTPPPQTREQTTPRRGGGGRMRRPSE